MSMQVLNPHTSETLLVPHGLVERLARLAFPERWEYAGEELGLLERYVRHTFARAGEQGRVTYASDSAGEFAVLATGLFDASFDDVYCVCEPQECAKGAKGPTSWEAKVFCTVGRSRYGRRLARACGDGLPLPATYLDARHRARVDRTLPIEVRYEELAAQTAKIASEALGELGGGDPQLFDEALHVAIDIARARLRRLPMSAVPAWGPAVGMEGVIYCVPLSFADTTRIDAALALEPPSSEGGAMGSYVARVMLSLEETRLAARIVGVPGGGSGWVVASRKTHEAVPGQEEKRAWDATDARARLTCKDAVVPPFIVRSGTTVGVRRRAAEPLPSIVLPSIHGFEGVSQIHGRFEACAEDVWEYVHEGSNWTLVRHADGSKQVLRSKGGRERLGYGDTLVFSGSPSFVLGR